MMRSWYIYPEDGTETRGGSYVRVYENGFQVDLHDLQPYGQYSSHNIVDRQEFIDCLNHNKLPKQVATSPHYKGAHFEYAFIDYQNEELLTTEAWKEYENSELEIKDYDPNWPALYKEEARKIKVSVIRVKLPAVIFTA